MGVLSLGVWGLSIPAATTCQAVLPVISSPAVATGIYWLLMFVTGEGGGATWMPIDLPLEGSCFHLPGMYLPDYSMSGSHVLWEARLSSQCSQKLPGKGKTQKGMGILSSRILQPEKHPLPVPRVHAS